MGHRGQKQVLLLSTNFYAKCRDIVKALCLGGGIRLNLPESTKLINYFHALQQCSLAFYKR